MGVGETTEGLEVRFRVAEVLRTVPFVAVVVVVRDGEVVQIEKSETFRLR